MQNKFLFLQKIILGLIGIFVFFATFNFFNNLVLKVINLRNHGLNIFQIVQEVFLAISATSFLTMIVALTALYFTLANYLRKDGNQVDAILGVEQNEKIIILVNKKDKPLIFNSINLLIDNDKYLVLSVKDKFRSFSDYVVVSPYSTLTVGLENSSLLDDLVFCENKMRIKIVLTTVEGLVICNKLEALPIKIRALRNSKKFKILDPNTKLDFEKFDNFINKM